MRETSEISEILAILRAARPRLIGIDGIDGSGKSTLALSLSKERGWSHINLDNHIDKNLGQYVNHVHYHAVRSELDEAKEPIIIEGVCLLA
jgi:thymidylate kinase